MHHLRKSKLKVSFFLKLVAFGSEVRQCKNNSALTKNILVLNLLWVFFLLYWCGKFKTNLSLVNAKDWFEKKMQTMIFKKHEICQFLPSEFHSRCISSKFAKSHSLLRPGYQNKIFFFSTCTFLTGNFAQTLVIRKGLNHPKTSSWLTWCSLACPRWKCNLDWVIKIQ